MSHGNLADTSALERANSIKTLQAYGSAPRRRPPRY
jgi:hypothetical protein